VSPESSQPPVHLSPPPKVGREASSTDTDAAAKRARADQSLRYWLTVLAFLALGATAFGVFVLLPRWVPDATAPSAAIEGATAKESAGAVETEIPSPAIAAEVDEPKAPTAMAPRAAPEPSAAAPDPPSRVTAEAPPAPADPTQEPFAQAMTQGLERLAQGELETAERAFEQALTLRPGAAEAADGLERIEAERQLVAIADHQERATAHEEQERWAEAAEEYAAVLALDATIRFAQEGQQRATARHGLSESLDSHISRPDRLASDQVLEAARDLLGEAREVDPKGPELLRQIDRLAAKVEIASTPIRVVLVSDGTTDVLLFRVGRLGTFERRELDLRPGTYTVVGTRDGYRDVRRTLEVTPGAATPSLTIRCEELI